jgi:transposase, IS5 family
VNVDDATKMITQSTVTAASVHDSKVLLEMLHAPEVGGALLHADSAYRSAELNVAIDELGLDNQVHERAYSERPLTEAQQASNKVNSKTRARVACFSHALRLYGAVSSTARVALNLTANSGLAAP